ncbi:hypothetical protein G6F35_014065 [Rhizopus arrhizus]|nr:hypothetical protein G6F35_014065 [Rhizopus arrhizus]
MVFTNVYNPRAAIERKNEYRNTLVRQGATLGANSTIVCGATVGRYAFVGAGAVVNKDVPDYALVVGVPAKQIGWMSRYGEQLDLPLTGNGQATCAHTGETYILKDGYQVLRDPINSRIQKVLDHGQYIMGPEVKELETALAAYTGAKHCITVASGTEALLIALMALGVKAGDEVITTSFTFVATAEVIVLLGAVPVFVDVEPDTCNIKVSEIEAKITPRTKAIIPVSLYGQRGAELWRLV